jgi:hypothetical protein
MATMAQRAGLAWLTPGSIGEHPRYQEWLGERPVDVLRGCLVVACSSITWWGPGLRCHGRQPLVSAAGLCLSPAWPWAWSAPA